MLPKTVRDLVDNFIRAFDSERPQGRAFADAHNKTAEFIVKNGLGGWCGFALRPLANQLSAYLAERACLVRDRLKQAVEACKVECYPEMSTDLKGYFATSMNPAVEGAVSYFEMLRKTANEPDDFTNQARQQFNNVMLRIDAELDLFCAEHAANQRKLNLDKGNQLANQVFNIDAVYGPVGNISNSQVTSLQQHSAPEFDNKTKRGRSSQSQDSEVLPHPEAQTILMFLFEQGAGMTVEEIGGAITQKTSVVEYYCGELANEGFVRQCRFRGDQRRIYGSDWGYDLTQKGRGWIIKSSRKD
jgi:hypothetical protein